MKETINQLVDALDRNVEYCNWVNEQTLSSYFKELENEIKELKVAIEKNDIKNIKEELGDIIWDALMLTKIAEQRNNASTEEIIQDVIKKIKRRKPYIFEGKKVLTEEANRIWKESKNKEK